MTTPRDLLIVTLDTAAHTTAGPPVAQGPLSLALAGAELLDLADARALTLDGDRIVPGPPLALPDHLLREAARSLVRQEPHESVEDCLWRRGRGLASTYVAALEAEGLLTRSRHRWNPLRAGPPTPADSAARRHATDRWASDEPVLASLAASAGLGDALRDEPAESLADLTDVAGETVVTVLAAVSDAVTELEAVRQRRSIEKAAFDNVWRGTGGI